MRGYKVTFFRPENFSPHLKKFLQKVFLTVFLRESNFYAKAGAQRMEGIGLICFGCDS